MTLEAVLGERCQHCGHVEEMTHWNPPGNLAPVGAWMYIKLPAGEQCHDESGCGVGITQSDAVVIAFRTRHLSEREGNMEYRLLDGSTVFGKFWWTHA